MSTKINGRTPEEIKRGLECCNMYQCPLLKCPYFNEAYCGETLNADALAYIQQLERERDAAVENLRGQCEYCANVRNCGGCEEDCDECPCDMCYRGDNWQWRGVQEAE